MSDVFKTEVYLDFNVAKIGEDIDEGVLQGLKEAAEMGVKDAERRFRSKTQGTGTGQTEKGFFDFKSFYHNGGWVFGTFGTKTGDWENSVGGRAHFFEYGRSAPGLGRGSTGKAMPVRWRAQKPRPFIRPAKNALKRKLGGITTKEIRSVARKMNRSTSIDRQVMSAINRIA
jgi:hypothetical protein